jgi:hypothetical protein
VKGKEQRAKGKSAKEQTAQGAKRYEVYPPTTTRKPYFSSWAAGLSKLRTKADARERIVFAGGDFEKPLRRRER